VAYIQDNLLNGEKIEYEAQVSLWAFWRNALLAVILFTVCINIDFLLALVATVIPLSFAAVRYFSTELATTNKRVIAKFGFIRRDTIEMNLEKVESIQVNQSIVGRIFNFGNIVISGAGNPQTPIVGISRPLVFRRRFLEFQDGLKGSAASEKAAA